MSKNIIKSKKYFKNTHRIIKQVSYILYGLTTFWNAYKNNTPLPITIISIVIFFIMVILTAIFAKKRDKFGIEGVIFHNNTENNYSDITKHFTSAKKIQIIAYHGERILSNTKTKLLEAIDNGAEVQILIAKKESELLKDVWKIESYGEEKEKLDASRTIIKNLNIDKKHNAKKVVFREYNTEVRYALIVVDEKWAWWTPYHPGKRVEDTTSLILSDEGDNSIIKDCLGHFNLLWEKYGKSEAEKETTSG
jgi:hypothetical protein